MAPWVYTVSAQKMLAAAVAVLSEIDGLSLMAFSVFRRELTWHVCDVPWVTWAPHSPTAPEPSQGDACLSFQSIFNRPIVTEAVWISDLREKSPYMRYLWG